MFCLKCGVELPDGSGFCNKCGAPQEAGGSAAKPPFPAGLPVSHDPPGPEEELWKGRFSGKLLAHWWILWVVELAVLAYLYWGPLSEKGWTRSVFAVLAGLPFLWILWTLLVNKLTVRYRLTTDRLFMETGFISRKLNEVELIRVDDVSVAQNLLQRILNVGRVTVISTDSTDPRLEIRGIDNPIEVKELIRTHVRKRRDRALHMESL